MNKFIFLFSILLLTLLSSCEGDDKKVLSYDEASQGVILSADLSASPEDNVKNYLAGVSAGYSNVRFFNEGGGTCGCTSNGGSCKCKLENVGGGMSCSEANTKCTKNKVIKIKVAPEDATAFASVGFK